MLWFSSEPPLEEESRLWVEKSFDKLTGIFGKDRLLKSPLVLPVEESFPDPFDGSEKSLGTLLKRVCGYMKVDHGRIDLKVLRDPTEGWKEILPEFSLKNSGAAGTYEKESDKSRITISISAEEFKDPIGLIATLAHELAHVRLLGDGKIKNSEQDMEPLTDLMTVFAGMGIFTANSTFQFKQYTDGHKQGWSYKRTGYLSQQMFGYALAVFAVRRGETDPKWPKYLNANVRSDFKKSLKFILKAGKK